MDQNLVTLLRSLQVSPDYDDAARLLPTATSLLTRLSNPLNVTLLASQLLSNSILYTQPISLAQCRQVFTIFYTAAARFAETRDRKETEHSRSSLSLTVWTTAVIKGADQNSPRWRHTLLLGGLLLGFERGHQSDVSTHLRSKLELALVTAVNMAISHDGEREPNDYLAVVWVLNTTFQHLSDHHRSLVEYGTLLPLLVEAAFFSKEGLEHGYWLGILDTDIKQISANKFQWSLRSPSGYKVQQLRSKDLVASMGPLARLIAHALENTPDAKQVLTIVERLAAFSGNLALSWRQNKFSEIDLTEEQDHLDEETVKISLPVLLQILRNTLFAIIVCLRAAIGRLLTDPILSSRSQAPNLAIRCLHILRDTYFIAYRFGQRSSSQYAFVNFAAIDILNQYPVEAEQFLTMIKPSQIGHIPNHPLDRIYDLYFFNLVEHFTMTLSPHTNEDLLLHAAMAYIIVKGDERLTQLYEAAHSVLLAVFAAPQNVTVSSVHIPFYVETLMQSFPSILSPRQFRLAIKSIVQLASPPSPLSIAMPLMQETLLEMLNVRCHGASEDILQAPGSASGNNAALSEKSVLLLSLIECLPYVHAPLLDTWLPTAAELVHTFTDVAQKYMCQKQFWDILSNGEMDVERAAACVNWWTTTGGKELVLYGELAEDNEALMHGGLHTHKL